MDYKGVRLDSFYCMCFNKLREMDNFNNDCTCNSYNIMLFVSFWIKGSNVFCLTAEIKIFDSQFLLFSEFSSLIGMSIMVKAFSISSTMTQGQWFLQSNQNQIILFLYIFVSIQNNITIHMGTYYQWCVILVTENPCW